MPESVNYSFLMIAGPDVSNCARGLSYVGWEGWAASDPALAQMLIDERAYDLAVIEARYAQVVPLARAKNPSLPVILLVDSDEDAQRGLARLGDIRVDAIVRWQDPPEVLRQTAQKLVPPLPTDRRVAPPGY